MNFSVIIFPGSNCDRDCVHVLKNIFNQKVEEVFHKENKLPDKTECVIIPGGFSYGDYLRPGSIARFSNIVNSIFEFSKTGGIVIGICNGFQILCEMGLLEGALTRNLSLNFICDEVYLKVANNKTPFTSGYNQNEVIKLPIAHGDGRYINPNVDSENIVFQYCDKDGNIIEKFNPNGSINNIAGVKNQRGNVLGMMPHPERASENLLGNTFGRRLFESIINSNSIVNS